MDKSKPENLEPGDWIFFNYGFTLLKWYIKKKEDDYVVLIPYDRSFLETRPQYKYLGKGEKRWWRKFIITFKDFIHIYLDIFRTKINRDNQ